MTDKQVFVLDWGKFFFFDDIKKCLRFINDNITLLSQDHFIFVKYDKANENDPDSTYSNYEENFTIYVFTFKENENITFLNVGKNYGSECPVTKIKISNFMKVKKYIL